MPSNLLAIDSNFPTFTGDEPVEQILKDLVNYLYQLKESLQYSLQNLSTDNFNALALESLTEEAKGEIGQQLQKLANELSQIRADVDTLKGRLSGIDALNNQVKENTDALASVKEAQEAAAAAVLELQSVADDLAERVGDAETDIDKSQSELETLKDQVENQGQMITALGGLIESLEQEIEELKGQEGTE